MQFNLAKGMEYKYRQMHVWWEMQDETGSNASRQHVERTLYALHGSAMRLHAWYDPGLAHT
eukprot:365778-Chlamydomonas_euryale.AAC.8